MLQRWADPNVLVSVGVKRLTGTIVKASNNHQGAERAEAWLDAARSAIELYLAERAWAVMDRGMPYVICDVDGTPVTP